jgi:hypothetical protein
MGFKNGSGGRSKNGSRSRSRTNGPGRGSQHESHGMSPTGMSPARVGPGRVPVVGPGCGSRTVPVVVPVVGPGGGRSGSGSKGGSKRGSQSQSPWLLERLDGSDAAWLSHRSRLMRSPCKDSCRRRGWRGRSGDCLGWRGGFPGGSTGGSLDEDSPMTSWLGVAIEVLNHLSRVG